MKTKHLTNFGDSVRARLLAIAQKENIQLEYLLLRYALERFLYRLGMSRYSDLFVLKGASVFAVWLGPLCRVTRDADVEAIRRFEPETLVTIFRDICALEYREDAVEFLLDTVNWIFLNLLSGTILLPIRCGLPRRGDGWIACLEVIDKAVALQQTAAIRHSGFYG